MYVSLTPVVARDLGKMLRFIRRGQGATLVDVAKRSGLSMGYVQNIESGSRLAATEDTWTKLTVGYNVDESVMRDLILRARVMTALERAGLDEHDAAVVWRGIEHTLAGLGRPPLDIAKVVAELMEHGR